MYYRIIQLFLVALLTSAQAYANPINIKNATTHAQAASQASSLGNWDISRREWAKAVINADLGDLDASERAIYYYEYGRAAGVTCFFNIAEEYLNKAYTLDNQIGGPSFLSLVELFRLNLDQKKYNDAVKYFDRALPELEKINAEKESPAEFSNLLYEYATALKGVKKVEDARTITARALKVKESAEYSITDRTPYGTKCSAP